MVPFIAASVVLALIAGVESAGNCPVRWHEFGGKCYFVSHDTETFIDALAICDLFHGQLAKIDSVQENAFLVNLTRHGTNLHKGRNCSLNKLQLRPYGLTPNTKLAKIDSLQETAFLVDLTRHGTNLHKAGFWIGLSDIEQEGTWVWTQDKSVLSSGVGVAIWGQGQPDNTNENENCVWLNGNDAGNWYDGHCSNAKNYMCERDMSTPGIVG